jgi:pSer/pThr/pTyr-binding forkhead associated (FHA) protein/Zn-dependent protease with chaperone function
MTSDVISSRRVRLRNYRYTGELLSLVLTFSLLFTLFALATVFFPESWSTTVKALTITLAGLAVFVVTVKLQQRTAFGTLVRVSARQFPELNQLALDAAARLSSGPVPVYVKRQSEMNVYTLGLWQHPIIVLTSSLVDQMEPGNLQFFIGREIGHIQAGHTWLRTLLKPLGADVPIVGKLLNSVVFGDWINRAEFTADRAGFIACGSLTTAVSTMLKFGVGVRLFEQLDIREFLEQINDVRNVSGHLTQIVAEQPYLTQRIRALVRYALSKQYQAVAPERAGHTQILQAMPEAFVSARLKFDEINDEASAVKQQAINNEPSRALQASAFAAPAPAPASTHINSTHEDEALTMPEGLPLEDENAPDANLRLVAVGGQARHVLRRRRTRIGRNQDNDIMLDNDRVSRYHAEIIREGDRLVLVDKKSRNGVWLNGERVRTRAVLTPGDIIRIGRQEFTFTVKEQI